MQESSDFISTRTTVPFVSLSPAPQIIICGVAPAPSTLVKLYVF